MTNLYFHLLSLSFFITLLVKLIEFQFSWICLFIETIIAAITSSALELAFLIEQIGKYFKEVVTTISERREMILFYLVKKIPSINADNFEVNRSIISRLTCDSYKVILYKSCGGLEFIKQNMRCGLV